MKIYVAAALQGQRASGIQKDKHVWRGVKTLETLFETKLEANPDLYLIKH